MKLKIGRRLAVEVSDFAEASKLYLDVRALSGVPASEFPTGKLLPGHFITYNGKVWKGNPKHWSAGATPVYEPGSRVSEDSPPFSLDEKVAALKAFALANYENGGDPIVECWDDPQYVETLTSAEGDLAKAKAIFEKLFDVFRDRQADARYYRDNA